jgi:hypothetical protein
VAPFGGDIQKYIKSIRVRMKEDRYDFEAHTNLLSIVLVIEYNNRYIFMTGYAESECIEKILQRIISNDNNILDHCKKFDIIKVPHHGSEKNNNIGLWQNFTKPYETVATISHGCRHGHPDINTINSVLNSNVKLYLTNRIETTRSSGSIVDLRTILGDTLFEGLELASIPNQTVEPYHGNITIILNNSDPMTIETQFDKPVLVKGCALPV